ncbi:hypothetical protein [Hahella sp. HN01]|uniref:hypothetical protein n=1 Tax=Hahella sp. HN01 TaxID=2847262 RepID=UPI001C1F0D99|nr:hypothetical protein [Hahella sp. HN01]MBU6951963.1 hypothetical protein [Hahella sp. HN01]
MIVTTLNEIGFWSNNYENGVTPSFLCGDIGSDKEGIISYLKNAARCDGWLGYARCRFECEYSESGPLGAAELTDGKWYWPEGLAHYVEAHNLLLPPQFLEHIRSLNYKVPELEPVFLKAIRNTSNLNENDELKIKFSNHIWLNWLREMGEEVYLKHPVIVPKAKPAASSTFDLDSLLPGDGDL